MTDDASEASPLPAVSAVVLSYNRREALRLTLEKLRETLRYPPDRLEVVVVDNASTDGSAEMVAAAFPGVRLIRNEKNIGVAGWNRGFAVSRGDYVLILDDDCYLTGDTLRQAVEAARARDADLVSFTVLSSSAGGASFNETYPTGLLSFWGCSALVSRRALAQLHGYDEHLFLWANELEFTMRLLDRGLRHLFLKEATSVHLQEPRPRAVYAYQSHRLNTRNFAYIAAKLLQPGDAAVVLVNLGAGLLLSALRHPRAFLIVPSLAEGLVTGLRHRAPVRSAVSTLYRRHFHGFVNRLPYMLRLRRWDRFYRLRAAFYPPGSGVLEV
jgi:GT2 family glycosyltransferase